MSAAPRLAYIDAKGRIVIDASSYEAAGSFSEGLAPVLTNEGRCGFINTSGDMVIRPNFYEAGGFSGGLAPVKIIDQSGALRFEPKAGYIDKVGQIVIAPEYDEAYEFSEGMAIAQQGDNIYLLDKTGKKTFFLNMNNSNLEFWTDPRFSEGLLAACSTTKEKCGFIDRTGKFVIEPRFSNVAPFSEGLARVAVIKNGRELVGFINRKGEFAIAPIFDVDSDFLRNATDFSEGLASLSSYPKFDRFLYIDKSGTIVFHTSFYTAWPFRQGLAVVFDIEKEKYGFIDKYGGIALPIQYRWAQDFSEGLALVAFDD